MAIVMLDIDLAKRAFALDLVDSTGKAALVRLLVQRRTSNDLNPAERLVSGSAPSAVQQGRL